MSEQLTMMEISILLHYHYSPEACPYVEDEWGGAKKSLEHLQALGLIEFKLPTQHRGADFTTTERGKVYAEAIRAVPLPVQMWVMP